MGLEISLNGAEADALKQILARHVRVLDKFEKKQLVNVTRKMAVARDDARHDEREAWRRFVWTADDVAILRHSRGTPDQQASSDGRCTCECHGDGGEPSLRSRASMVLGMPGRELQTDESVSHRRRREHGLGREDGTVRTS